ncbi:hypothetical protein ES703_121869 [subsurface metagenome]
MAGYSGSDRSMPGAGANGTSSNTPAKTGPHCAASEPTCLPRTSVELWPTATGSTQPWHTKLPCRYWMQLQAISLRRSRRRGVQVKFWSVTALPLPILDKHRRVLLGAGGQRMSLERLWLLSTVGRERCFGRSRSVRSALWHWRLITDVLSI